MLEQIYNSERIGGQLVKDGLVTQEQLQIALGLLEKQGGFLGKPLVDNGFVPEEAILSYFLDRYALPYAQLAQFPINRDSLKFVSADVAAKYLLLPVDHIGIRLTVVAPGPMEGAILGKALDACKGCPVTYYLSSISEIETAVAAAYGQ